MRQDICHSGYGYKSENYRLFVYLDLKDVKRENDGTTHFNIPNRQRIKADNIEKEILKKSKDLIKKSK